MPQSAVETHSSYAHPARLVLIAPLALERQCLTLPASTSPLTHVTVTQSGQGADNAARAARAAIDQGATALMSIGVAGGLIEGLSAGDAVLPDAVLNAASGRSFACTQPWSEALRDCIGDLGRVNGGRLLSVTDVLESAAEKSAAAARFAAVACDMESAAIAQVAADAQIQFAALRVISDAYTDELPQGVSSWVDEFGNARIRPVLGAMMSPGRWRTVISMTSRFRLAQRRLREFSERLASAAYCCPQS